MIEFFQMGGYAFHVWTCWGLSALALSTLYISRAARLRKTRNLSQDTPRSEDEA